MMFGQPIVEDYDHACYDPFWEACVDLGLPVNFHILTSKSDLSQNRRGPSICTHQRIIRGNQDILSMFVFGGVFERHPKLRVVLAESDASWVPHFGNKMDHAWTQYRFREPVQLSKWPSAYLRDNCYFTMQDDMPVGLMTDVLPMERILWASDFPHSDGTYPKSREVLTKMGETMSAEHLGMMAHDNVAALYGLSV
jgi:predicted TIM-barrel fold metal-dependent hydrolase